MRDMASAGMAPTAPQWEKAMSRAGEHYRAALSRETGAAHQELDDKIREFIWAVYPDESFQQRLLEPGP